MASLDRETSLRITTNWRMSYHDQYSETGSISVCCVMGNASGARRSTQKGGCAMRAYVISIGLALGFNVAFAGPAGTAEGTVNEVKSKAGKLNITHGTISDLMEAMTMDFEVVDPSMTDDVKKGDKIRFTVEKATGGRFVITDIQVTGKAAVAQQ